MSDRIPDPAHGDEHTGPRPGEKQHVFDKPENVRRLLYLVYTISAALFLADFVVHRHLVHPFEGLPGFYAIYGWAACVSLVLIAKQLRKILIRDEDYYDAV